MKIDPNISDLFFNTDTSRAVMLDKKGRFEDFDNRVLSEEADMLLQCLDRLGVTNLPTREELVGDFLARV